MSENMETAQLERKERERQERGASEKETQVVQISTLRKLDLADTIWEDKEETKHKYKWTKQKLME